MLISTIEELRLSIPAHAIDDIAAMKGFIENSESDFLKEKLGDALYQQVIEKYKELDIESYLGKIENNDGLQPWERLIMMCQRCVSFDAMGRAISVQAISVNNSGINVSTSDDYEKVDNKTVADFKAQCSKEAHASVNHLLQSLEAMDCEVKAVESASKEPSDDAEKQENEADNNEDNLTDLAEKKEIVDLWSKSRYYFLVASLLIPSAAILQDFVNIYDNREKFIQLLPDLHYVQEEQLAPTIGEELMEALVTISIRGTEDKVLARIIYRLRKALASGLEARTTLLNIKQARQQQAHDELLGYLKSISAYIGDHQEELMEDETLVDAVKTSPCYRPSVGITAPPKPKEYENKPGNAMFVTPMMH